MKTFREGCFRTQHPGPENAHKRAEGQQEGLTSGLTYRPRRPPSWHRCSLEEENSGDRRAWEHVCSAVVCFNVFSVKGSLSSLSVTTNVPSALWGIPCTTYFTVYRSFTWCILLSHFMGGKAELSQESGQNHTAPRWSSDLNPTLLNTLQCQNHFLGCLK